MQKMIKLAIADDHTLFRKTLAEYLYKQSSFEIAITACDFSDLREQLRSTQVHVLLTDIYMPCGSGMESLKTIRTEYPDLKIVILSMSTDIKLVNELLDIGIYAFISKADEAEQLVEAIIAAYNDQIYRNPYLTEALYLHKQLNCNTHGDCLHTVLDSREKKVLQLLWQEKSNKDIAKEIFLSVRSVEKIRQDMKQKLGVKSMIGLLKYGLIHNIIEPTEIHILDTSGYLRTMYA